MGDWGEFWLLNQALASIHIGDRDNQQAESISFVVYLSVNDRNSKPDKMNTRRLVLKKTVFLRGRVRSVCSDEGLLNTRNIS